MPFQNEQVVRTTNGNENGNCQTKRTEISTSLRWITNVCHLISVFLFGGIIFGWAPLKLVLLAEGQYSESCAGNMNLDDTCAGQMRRYNAIFTLGQFSINFASLPVGFFIDMISKPVYFTIAGICQITGFILFGISDSNNLDYFAIAYGLMALGGSMSIIGALPASFLVRPRRYQPLLLAASSCLFDASSIIFYLIYKITLVFPITFNRKRAFFGLAIVAFIVYTILVACWVILEKKDWKQVCDNENNIGVENNEEFDSGNSHNNVVTFDQDNQDHRKKRVTVTSTSILHSRRIHNQRLHGLSVIQQFDSFDFTVIFVFFSVHVLQCNLYIETVNEYLTSIGDNDGTYAKIFSLVLPCGIIFIPFIDATIQKVGSVNTLKVTNALSLIFGFILLFPNLTVQTINFGIFTCFRAYLYATLNTFIAETFGLSTIGRMIGCTCTVGSFLTLLQYPAASIAEGYVGDGFGIVNLFVLVISCLPVIITAWYSNIILEKERHHNLGKNGGANESSCEKLPLMGKKIGGD